MYLSIDLGDKRCGTAVFIDPIVVPKDIILRPKLIGEIKKYIKAYEIKIIVVGLPYDLYGKNLKQLEKTKGFIAKLKIYFPDLQIDGFDERYTSFEADMVLNQLGINDTQGKKDAISAAIILEGYLKQKNKM